ncbi:sphingomyelin phosphodiesterase [Phanerochaete sordida]|uniref:Sphingomyelin phosphodiesterase n=1 Tax=Phanerochaete sordida TaxID=48140 RepID=A0A9P3L9L6_9APHY|nr:sphingomyelin phosphodiesterase [Phanerochaete sordida]
MRVLDLAIPVVSTGLVAAAAAGNGPVSLGPSSFAVPGVFPTSVYKSFFNDPTATSAQPQPVITDPITHVKYPEALTDPNHIPQNDTKDPHPLPNKASDNQLFVHAVEQVTSIRNNPIFAGNECATCQALLEVFKFVAMAAPEQGPALAVQFCHQLDLASDCDTMFGILGIGPIVTQVIANADVGGFDGQMLCENFLGMCPLPPVSPLNLTGWFAKPKPNPLPPPKKPSGKRLKVLHLSDVHIDPRYATGTEANCSSGLCCRSNVFNSQSPNVTVRPAPRYGSFLCDAPFSLILAGLQSIPVLTDTEKTGFDFTIYTGDLVSHDPDHQLSRDYIMYTETVLYDLYKRLLGSGPVYASLGNHDTYNQAQDAPHALGPPLADQFQWDYDHLASLWEHEKWLPEAAVAEARAHYSAYMVRRVDGLRIITINTDMWYKANWFNYINMTTHDPSGMLRFVTDELQAAEDAGDRVWILGHVLAGWDGTNALGNPTDLFYQIVDRFSPHVIANIFWGHTHEDELSIFYTNNGTVQSRDTALTPSWITPSLTPLTNLNSGFRMYEVDSNTFDILDAHTWMSDVNTFPSLDSQIEFGPTYKHEYSTREAYGANITGWGPNDPLNGTWWHLVTEQMENNPALVQQFNTFQGKTSVRSPFCSGDCIAAKICYIRSGSVPLALSNCIPGFGSVQSQFSGK